MTAEVLGKGTFSKVRGCRKRSSSDLFAVKTILTRVFGGGGGGVGGRSSAWSVSECRALVLKEVDILTLCTRHNNIIQLINFFDEPHRFRLLPAIVFSLVSHMIFYLRAP